MMTEGLEGVEELNDNDLGFQVTQATRRNYCPIAPSGAQRTIRSCIAS